MSEWWESAPTVDQAVSAPTPPPAPSGGGKNWWEDAPAVQELRAGPGPKGKWWDIYPVDDPNKSAGVGATLEASLHSDPAKQIKVYAKAMGIDERRFGIDRDGSIIYMDPNNNDRMTKVQPSVMGATGVFDFFRRLGQKVGAEAAPAAPQVAAGTVGTLMGPTPASIPAAAATAGAVDYGRQVLGNYVSGFPNQFSDVNGGSILGQAGTAALGQGTTVGINSAFSRNSLGAGQGDIQKLADPQRYTEYQKIEDRLRSQGLQGTPGEITNARSLLQRQRQLGRFDETATTMGDFYRNRNEVQIPGAFQQTMDAISPEVSPAIGARRLQSGAEATIDALNQQRAKAADPLYKEAFSANKDMASPVIDRILETPAGKEAMSIARERMQNRMSLMATPDAELTDQMRFLADIGRMERVPGGVSKGLKLETLDLIKQSLDDMIGQARTAAANGTGRKGVAADLTDLKKAFVKELDALDVTAQAGPNSFKPEGGAYARARATYQAGSPEIDAAKDGLVGLAAADRASGLQNVPRTMFDISRADPISTASARSAFEKAGKLEDWNAGLRAYLTNTFSNSIEKSGMSGNLAGSIYKSVAGNPQQMATLKAAMTPEQFAAFKTFSDNMDVIRRALPEGSPTATDLGGREAFAGPAARALSKIPRVLSPQNIGDNLADFALNMLSSNRIEAMANVITNPQAIAELQKLRTLPPLGQKALTVMNDILANYGTSKVGDLTGIGRPRERVPEAYRE